MMLELPFAHPLTTIKPRHRAPSTTWVVERHAFEVPDVASGDARPVVTWTANADAAPNEVVANDGRLFAPITEDRPRGDGHRSALRITHDRFEALVAPRWGLCRFPPMLRRLFPALDDPVADDDLARQSSLTRAEWLHRGGRVVATERSAWLAMAARTYATGLLLVDGEPWWSHDGVEPTWRVRPDRDGTAIRLATGRIGWWEVARRADDVEGARKAARALGGKGSRFRVAGAAQVHDPTLLRDAAVLGCMPLVEAVVRPAVGLARNADGRPVVGLVQPFARDATWTADLSVKVDRMVGLIDGGTGTEGEAIAVARAVCDVVEAMPCRPPAHWRRAREFLRRVDVPYRHWRSCASTLRVEAARAVEDEELAAFAP